MNVNTDRFYIQWLNVHGRWIDDTDYPEGFLVLSEAKKARDYEEDRSIRRFRIVQYVLKEIE